MCLTSFIFFLSPLARLGSRAGGGLLGKKKKKNTRDLDSRAVYLQYPYTPAYMRIHMDRQIQYVEVQMPRHSVAVCGGGKQSQQRLSVHPETSFCMRSIFNQHTPSPDFPRLQITILGLSFYITITLWDALLFSCLLNTSIYLFTRSMHRER